MLHQPLPHIIPKALAFNWHTIRHLSAFLHLRSNHLIPFPTRVIFHLLVFTASIKSTAIILVFFATPYPRTNREITPFKTVITTTSRITGAKSQRPMKRTADTIILYFSAIHFIDVSRILFLLQIVVVKTN